MTDNPYPSIEYKEKKGDNSYPSNDEGWVFVYHVEDVVHKLLWALEEVA